MEQCSSKITVVEEIFKFLFNKNNNIVCVTRTKIWKVYLEFYSVVLKERDQMDMRTRMWDNNIKTGIN